MTLLVPITTTTNGITIIPTVFLYYIRAHTTTVGPTTQTPKTWSSRPRNLTPTKSAAMTVDSSSYKIVVVFDLHLFFSFTSQCDGIKYYPSLSVLGERTFSPLVYRIIRKYSPLGLVFYSDTGVG